MTGRRRTLRSRLLIAMAAIAIGVVVVTGVTTVALARRTAERTARSHLEEQIPDVKAQLAQLRRALIARDDRGLPTVGLGRLVSSVLRVSNGTLLTVRRDGTVTEGLDGLVGARVPSDTAVASGTKNAARERLRQRLRARLGLPSTTTPSGTSSADAVGANPLPAGLSLDDFDAPTLLRGDDQTGSVDGQVFVAEPIRSSGDTVAVLVLTERIDSAALNRARGFFLVGAALALLAAGAVSYFLARRLTRPLAAMGVTAGAIAGGDLGARVELGKHPDDELADLARSLNGMATELEIARHGERQFLLSVSHDLRTPLTSIRGYADALTDGTIPASEAQQRAAAVISAEADRLERLVADLLDLARIDAHQFSLSPRPFDLAAGVQTAVAAFMPAAAELGIELSVRAPASLPFTGDAERIGQIVANLVENALKYARTSIVVTVGSTEDGRAVELRVADDGPGVDPHEQERVFERLFVSRSTPGRSVGTGLGLAIVGELAAAMGGRAAIDPTATGGATFVVSLPTSPVPPS
ncbi:MAG: HAMP domain-containing sensor histidine kinase [Acidimicrobiia bacterium]